MDQTLTLFSSSKSARAILALLFLLTSVPFNSYGQTNVALTATAAHSGGGATTFAASNYNDGIIAANSGSCTSSANPWGWVTTNGWITFTWTSAQTFNKIVLYKSNRPMRTCTMEYWNGSSFVSFLSYSGSTCTEDSVTFSPITTTILRFNTVAGSSNPNHREIQVWQTAPAPPSVTGVTTVCEGSTLSLTASSPASSPVYNWTGPAGFTASTATINVSSISLAGAGVYSVTVQSGPTGLPSNPTTRTVTVTPSALPITGASCVVVGSTTNLSDATPGGTWSSSSTAIATISSTGVVSGLSAGTTNITYVVGSGCPATFTLTVSATPVANSGATSVCNSGTATVINASAGGTWTSSDPSLASIDPTSGEVTGIATGSAIITYTMPSTCFSTSSLTVNPNPPSIGGPDVVCMNATINLTNPFTGGTWSSGMPFIATVAPGTGTVTGVAAGTASITYTTSTGCVTSKMITVNSSPLAITGAGGVCVGSTMTLSNSTPSGTWSTSSPSLATVAPGTGVVTGMSAGTPLITYASAITGCRVTAQITVNPLPSPITGSSNACVGANITLTNTGGGTWSSSNTSVATIGVSSGTLTGITVGTTDITYTLPTGCSTSMPVLVNPLPTAYAVTGGGGYCSGGSGVHVGLAYAGAGVDYQLRNGGLPVGLAVAGSNSGLDFGSQTAAGVYTVVANNALTGCSRIMPGSVTVTINSLPGVFNVTGGGGFCAGTAGVPVGTDGSEAGRKYQLYEGTTPIGSLVTGTGGALNFGLFNVAGNYTVWAINSVTGCTVQMAGNASIIANPLPAVFNVTGGGGYCPGGSSVHITLDGSTAGSNYQLYRGSTAIGSSVAGTGSSLDFGGYTTTGTYTVVVTDGLTGCSGNMAGSASIVISPLPVVYSVTGGGGYCTGGVGSRIGLSYSTPGIDYQLWYDGSAVTTVGGSGSGLDFGLHTATGVYTVVAVNTASGCVNNMSGSATISINPLPAVNTVTGGGNFCLGTAGVHIGTDMSETGVSYRLYRGSTPVGVLTAGTGGALDFGMFTAPGTYTVTGTNATTGCASPQLGNAIVTPTALPVLHAVSGGGNYCSGGSGVSVRLNGSSVGVDYELYFNGTTTGIFMPGTGSGLDFGPQFAAGVYMMVGRDQVTGCARNMTGSATVAINPLPNAFNVTGGGSYCAGSAGVRIGVDGSNTGISYRLYNSGGASGSAVSGTGGVLDFGFRTTADNYYVIGRNPITGCEVMMNGGAVLAINPLPADYATGGGGSYCAGGAGLNITLTGSDPGVDYQLYHNGIPNSFQAGTGLGIDFGIKTAVGTYNVKAIDALTGCTKNMSGSAIINIVSPSSFTVTGGGSYCAGGSGVHVGLSGSQTGVDYQLYSSGAAMGTALPGTGASLDFGLQTVAGIDSVVATNATYGCVKLMTGTATVAINPLPVVNNVTGGGIYCAGGSGVHIGLDNSGTGIRYQLYNGTSTTGTPLTGTGSALDFGIHTGAGNYTVIATNITTLCAGNMAGSAVITVRPLPAAYEVKITGVDPGYPGYYCASDSGVHIYLPGSDAGVGYQLYRGTTMIGSAIAGTGSLLDLGLQPVAGTYTVVGTDMTTGGCSNNMTGSVDVNIVPLPTVYNVTGGGSYCPGGAGRHITLDLSQVGVYYKLYRSNVEIDTLIYGTGVGIDFGEWDTAVYKIKGFSHVTDCPNNMLGTATVTIDSVRTPVVSLKAYPGTGIGVWHVDSLQANVINGGPAPTYQWYINGNMVPGATNASLTRREFFNNDSVSVVVTASGNCGGNTVSRHLIITLLPSGVNGITSAGSDIRLAPNPNKGVFTVKGTLAGITGEISLDVTNMLGQVVYSRKAMVQNGVIDEQVQLDGGLASGMYLLNLRSGSENAVFHFMVGQ